MAHHETHEHPAPPMAPYRKKQAVICILVFVCIAITFIYPTLPVVVGAILAACALCGIAAKMQPPPPEEEHHH
jgi:hypothetical protein|uniref:Uncharacterized protein n=1 Tax=Desulfobacca acetoxidans TaxID=60893 RepID=A0A7C5ALP4_9BACT